MSAAQKRILVTGGAGFLGSHLCDRLSAEGHAVVCLDDFRSGRRENIAHLEGTPGFTLIEHDVTAPFHHEVDEIYNLACPASPVAYQRDPVGTIKTCVLGAINVLELAARLGCKVLQASTSEVYGDPKVHPQPESYNGNVNPIGPRACYDEGKRAAETLFFDFHRTRGVRIKVARIFNTYGPRMLPDDGRVVSSFIVQALSGENLTVFGDGAQTRSFCYVDDLIDGLLLLMATGLEVTGPVNLGNREEVTVAALAQRVLALVSSRARVVLRPLPKDDPHRRSPDLGLAERLLGFRPRVSMEEGLVRTVRYFGGA